MIRVAVCDDEKNIRSYLSGLIRKQGMECEVTEYASGEDYLSGREEYDVLFLDIELNSGLSGMDGMALAKRVRSLELSRQPIIIFVTGYEKYVYEAFDVEAFQYLVKPIDEQRFAEVFKRAAGHILAGKGGIPEGGISHGEACSKPRSGNQSPKGCIVSGRDFVSLQKGQKKVLEVQYANANRLIPLDNIYYMESRSHKVVLHLKEGELEYYAKIGELEARLQGQFCRIHKGYLINLSCVEEYTRTEVTLTGGGKLPISKYKYGDFVKTYLRFMQLGS